jgi:hypothetical protein
MGEIGSVLYRIVSAGVGTGADFCARSVVTRREQAVRSDWPTVKGALESKRTALREGKISGMGRCRLTIFGINAPYAVSHFNSLVLGLGGRAC